MKLLTRLAIAVVICAAGFAAVVPAHPVQAQLSHTFVTFGVDACTNHDPNSVNVGETYFKIDVVDIGPGRVLFWIRNTMNTVPPSSMPAIAWVNFDDDYLPDPPGSINAVAGLIDSDQNVLGDPGYQPYPNVDFTQITNPLGLHLFDVCNPPYEFDIEFQAIQDIPNNPLRAVGPGEALGVVFNLEDGIAYHDLVGGMQSCQVQVGLFAQGFMVSGRPSGNEVFVTKCEPGTYVQLASFTAEPADGAVDVRWETGAEVDNVGFNLYRSTSLAGPFEKVNDQLIAAQGSATGAVYEYVDHDGDARSVYRLEDIDYSGTRTQHLPVHVKGASVMASEPVLFLPFMGNRAN